MTRDPKTGYNPGDGFRPSGKQIVVLRTPEAVDGEEGFHWVWAKEGSYKVDEGGITYRDLDGRVVTIKNEEG